MSTTGKLVMLIGLFGSGKSTLSWRFLEENPDAGIMFLQYCTTRSPRTREEICGLSKEYEFVTQEEYQRRRTCASKWDHKNVGDTYYGVDAGEVENQVRQGVSFITYMLPVKGALAIQRAYFNCPSVSIFLNVRRELANARVMSRDGYQKGRMSYQAELVPEEYIESCDHVFTPTHTLEADTLSFTRLLLEVIK